MKNIFILFVFVLAGCSDFLEESSQDRVRPTTVSDLEEMFLGEAYLETYDIYGSTWMFTDDIKSIGPLHAEQQELHDDNKWLFTWDENMFSQAGSTYNAAFYEAFYKGIQGCNLVLDYLDEMDGDQRNRESLRGEALTLRAWYYLHLVNLYGIAYNQGDPSTDLAIPLKLKSAVTGEFFRRNTVGEVYARIEQDLLEGNRLLKMYDFDRNYLRLSHLGAKAILSRMYLYMENWDQALVYADSVLMVKNSLLDLSSLNWVRDYCVYNTATPDEMIWARPSGYTDYCDIFWEGPFIPSDELLGMFERGTYADYTARRTADLRSVMYFYWGFSFLSGANYCGFVSKGGSPVLLKPLQGIRTAELYLNRAEAYARKYLAEGNDAFRVAALSDLNTLRLNRYSRVAPYEEVNLSGGTELLQFCLEERRRELCVETNHRWCDLRRFGVTVVHDLKENNTTTEFTKDMSRYVLPFQAEVVEQNPYLGRD